MLYGMRRLRRASGKIRPAAGPTVQAIEISEHMSVTGQRLIRRTESGDWSFGWIAVSNPRPPGSGRGEPRLQVLPEEAWHHLAIVGTLPPGESPRELPVSQVRVLVLVVPQTMF
ncbi:hypothetical protein GCM10017673_37920 [Streptosporangium violaceochromogenes]|nr:hypothetical protein GCM10017673_37920 [Streptosporangium violaceochromogenes]